MPSTIANGNSCSLKHYSFIYPVSDLTTPPFLSLFLILNGNEGLGCSSLKECGLTTQISLGLWIIWNDTTNPLVNRIRDFTSFLRDWNRTSFGNVFNKKKKILACINGVQRALANDPNEFLFKLQQTLAKDYMDILKQEEDL
ncbi:hypothetical protein J1N35_039708 [Gossypium stocksii]|uniref:Uncharacterized protein n=1 Tax=Gossypium stocksii TaxID=47602 RepID=A0A9D3UC85_9ROSI|nr:hypothetical protein J1N35_039708 [Gossypium stocksii]